MRELTNDHSAAAREHAWKYFELHADQRMSLFNFFLILSGLVLAGIGGCIAGDGRLQTIGAFLGAGLSVVSLIFFKLDQRVSFLMKRAELALAEMEGSFPICARLFSDEPDATKKAWRDNSIWTYGRSFRAVFWITGIGGITAIIIALR